MATAAGISDQGPALVPDIIQMFLHALPYLTFRAPLAYHAHFLQMRN